MKMIATAGALALVSVAAFAQNKPQGTQLKNADLSRTFISGTMTIGDFTPQALSSARLFLRGGILHLIYADPEGNGDYVRGQWRIEQDTLCTSTLASPERCATLYKLSDGSFQSWLDGKLTSTFRVIPPPTAAALKPTG